MEMQTDIKQAIIDLEWMRKTHADWAEHFEKHPELEAEYAATGEWDDAKEHRRIMAMYDNAIACLKTISKDTDHALPQRT